jgi:hypothetical protein
VQVTSATLKVGESTEARVFEIAPVPGGISPFELCALAKSVCVCTAADDRDSVQTHRQRTQGRYPPRRNPWEERPTNRKHLFLFKF